MGDSLVVWSASHHSNGSGSLVYGSVLEEFQNAMGTQLSMSTTFHAQMDGQSEQPIHILEDMMRACILDLKGS